MANKIDWDLAKKEAMRIHNADCFCLSVFNGIVTEVERQLAKGRKHGKV